MKKTCGVLLCAFLLLAEIVIAAGGSSSGSRSSSSSGSSSGGSRSSYSSGSSSGSKSYTAPSSSSGSKSYTAPSSSGSKYSSGSSSKSYTAPSSSGSKYSSGSGSGSSGSSSPSLKPSSSNFNSGLGEAARKQESKVLFEKATAPKSTYRDNSGTERKIDPASKHVETIRNIPTERYTDRNVRVQNFYGYSSPPVVHGYSDPFGPFFYLWLFDRATSDERASWAYHHRNEIDNARWADMVKKDKELEAKVKKLEADKVAKDVGFVPAGLKDNPDLMYSDEFVAASYNAQEVEVPETGLVIGWGWIVFWIILSCVVIVGIVYLIFFYEY
jgi:hypothetical protein